QIIALPFAATQSATQIAANDAILNGMATPGGLPAVAWFEWGTNSGYRQATPAMPVGSGTTVVPVSFGVSNLVARETYHCRLVVSNADKVAPGADQSFVTAGGILAWGDNAYGQTDVPADLTNVVGIAVGVGSVHSLALRNNGTVTAWG